MAKQNEEMTNDVTDNFILLVGKNKNNYKFEDKMHKAFRDQDRIKKDLKI
jgi:hypothetical protein